MASKINSGKGIRILAMFTLLLISFGCITQGEAQEATTFSSEYGRYGNIYGKVKADFLRPFEEVKEEGEKRFTIVAAPSSVEILPGFTLEDSFAYNGQIPGPVLRVKLGERVTINFTNRLPQPTTVHFHGVRVPNAMDGVPGVTQPPVEPGGSFLYSFVPKDPGTYWFHPHVRGHEQLERGLYGALIVEDESAKYYDKDVVVFLDDWLLTEDGLYENFDNPHFTAMNGRWGNVIAVNGKPVEVIRAKPGERIRLRFIDAANARIFRLNGEGLVIAVDGFYVREPFPLQNFDVAPGNRVDVDVIAKDGNITFYDAITGKPLVIVVGEGEKVERERKFPFLREVPSLEEALALPVDYTYTYTIRMVPGRGPVWEVNGKSWPEAIVYRFDKDKVNVVRLIDKSGRVHPVHFHGLFFKVLRRNGQFVDEGFYRDTVILYPNDVVDIVLVPTEGGKWLNHCHIQEHAEHGFMTYTIVV